MLNLMGLDLSRRRRSLPGADTPWQSDGDVLTPAKPVTLLWDNGQGLIFRRTIRVDEDFLFTITDSVQNNRDAEVTLFPYGLIARGSTPRTEGFYILHEGLWVFLTKP